MISTIAECLNITPTSQKKLNENFFAEYSLNPNDISLHISPIGDLQFPITKETIKKLIEFSSPAQYGHRELTILDKNVRDTSEISADKINLNLNEKNFTQMLKEIGKKLNLPPNSSLKANLHNMLIYSPGQFFKPHQDSEKLPNMIASLVVVLPTPHIGGNLLIKHHHDSHTFVSENIDEEKIQCVAFYSDCEHEIKKIKKGSRIALTFNLVLESNNLSFVTPVNQKLIHALKAYFSQPTDSIEVNNEPQKFVYLFEHEYTEHSLKWNVLKGNDNKNAQEFLAVAKKLNLIPHLALVEIHQSWSSFDEEELQDLIDEEITFSSWFDKNGNKLSYDNLSVSHDEICSLIDIDNMEPSHKEYEGFMGNYGNTMDYWYRKAALILWPESDQILMDFELNYSEAIANLVKLTEAPGNEKQVINVIQKALPYIQKENFYSKCDFLKTRTPLACYVNNPQLANSILKYFSLPDFNQTHGEEIEKLIFIYGEEWVLDLFKDWEINHNEHNKYHNEIKFEEIHLIIENLTQHNCSSKFSQFLIGLQFNYIKEKNKNTSNYSYYIKSEVIEKIKNRIHAIQNLYEACEVIQETRFQEKIMAYILSNTNLYPEFYLADFLIHFQNKKINKNTIKPLSTYVLQFLQTEFNEGLRHENDWSMKIKLSCQCHLCKVAEQFFQSTTEISKTWPIVTSDRNHIIEIIKRRELPIDYSILKKGSPHKLVLDKNSYLYNNAKQRYKTLQYYLNTLKIES